MVNIGNCVAYANGDHEQHVLNLPRMQIRSFTGGWFWQVVKNHLSNDLHQDIDTGTTYADICIRISR